MKHTILVIGGGGMLGQPVARQLLSDGYTVRLLTRNPDKTAQALGEGFEIARGDVEDPESIRSSLKGCMGVHVSLMGGPRPEDFDRIEHQGTARIANISFEMGIAHLTYLSGAPVHEQNFRDPGSKAKFFAEGAIRKSGIPFTIFRATWMMESLPLFVRGKMALVIGKQAHPVRWLAAQDYARMVSRAHRSPEARNKSLFVAGPGSYTKPEALAIYRRIVRPELKVIRVPLWLMSIIGTISLNSNLQNDVRRMAFYNEIGDDFGDPTEANALFGKPMTTLEDWCENQKRGMST